MRWLNCRACVLLGGLSLFLTAAGIGLLARDAEAEASALRPVRAQQVHDLKLAPDNVHWGYYDARVKPVLTIASGDRVRVETMAARGLERLRLAGVAESEIPESMKAVEAAVTARGPGAHPLTGPIFVSGAEPGDSLEVRIGDIQFLHPYGVIGFLPGGGTLPSEFPYAYLKLVRFDPSGRTARFAPGVTLPLAPFFGSIGVAPPVLSGRVSSGPPGPHVGNLDIKELGAGSTIFLPVHVPGALLSIGDGHAAQGDGEVTGTAIETSLATTIQVVLHKKKPLRFARIETATHVITVGLDPDLDEAARIATREMVDYLVAEKRLSRDDAYTLCSAAVDLRVSQVVDVTKGVHAMLARSLFQ
ncbi:MAG: acetamidase/formamidase family protein [Acidobacteria bacterium]|nr:acetamidase/formamidase family protein [Acidobacteriota bacterium]